jgi:hypothetical protein
MKGLARLFQSQMLDRGIDMGGADKKAHPVELAELRFECGNHIGKNHAVLCRKA